MRVLSSPGALENSLSLNPGELWSGVAVADRVQSMVQIEQFNYVQTNDMLNWIVDQAISLMSRVFANGPGDQSSIPGRIIPKTGKMVLD